MNRITEHLLLANKDKSFFKKLITKLRKRLVGAIDNKEFKKILSNRGIGKKYLTKFKKEGILTKVLKTNIDFYFYQLRGIVYYTAQKEIDFKLKNKTYNSMGFGENKAWPYLFEFKRNMSFGSTFTKILHKGRLIIRINAHPKDVNKQTLIIMLILNHYDIDYIFKDIDGKDIKSIEKKLRSIITKF
jgi:hypothetical protein